MKLQNMYACTPIPFIPVPHPYRQVLGENSLFGFEFRNSEYKTRISEVCRGSARGARSRGSRESGGSRAIAGRAGREGPGASADKKNNNKNKNSPSRSTPRQTRAGRKLSLRL